MYQRTLIVIAIGLLIIFSGAIAAGAAKAFTFLRTRLPSMPSPWGAFRAVLAYELRINALKALALFALAWFGLGGMTWRGCDWRLAIPWVQPSPNALIVMMHEASHGPLSQDAIGAANELTAAGREVRMIDDDVVDGTGETPEWLKPGLAKGREIMGGTDGKTHVLLLLSGQRIVKAEKLPGPRAEIVRACQ